MPTKKPTECCEGLGNLCKEDIYASCEASKSPGPEGMCSMAKCLGKGFGFMKDDKYDKDTTLKALTAAFATDATWNAVATKAVDTCTSEGLFVYSLLRMKKALNYHKIFLNPKPEKCQHHQDFLNAMKWLSSVLNENFSSIAPSLPRTMNVRRQQLSLNVSSQSRQPNKFDEKLNICGDGNLIWIKNIFNGFNDTILIW